MNSFTRIFLIFSIIIEYTSTGRDAADVSDTEYMSIKRLRERLFTDYDKTVRPVAHHSNTTSVNLTFASMYSFAYEERNETLTLEAAFRLKWLDPRWVWNPNEYGGMDFFPVDADEIWLPDIGIYESIPAQEITNRMKTRPMAYSFGKVMWSTRGVFKTLCPFQKGDYPSDIQVCNLTFGSWAEDGLSIDLQIESRFTYLKYATNAANRKWNVLHVNLTRVISYRNSMGNPFVNIVATIRFQRRPVIESKVVAAPLIAAIILILTMFWVPPGFEKKLTLGCTAFFILVGLLLYVAASVRSPLMIGVAVAPIRSVIFITISALLLEIVVIIISSLTMSPPLCLNTLIDGNMGKILFLNFPRRQTDNEETDVQNTSIWYKAAMAGDRVLFILFLLICIVNQILQNTR